MYLINNGGLYPLTLLTILKDKKGFGSPYNVLQTKVLHSIFPLSYITFVMKGGSLIK